MCITKEMQSEFLDYLRELERSKRTITKYRHDVERFAAFAKDEILSKNLVLQFKESLHKEMSPVSANSIICAINSFLKFLGVPQFCVKMFRVQRQLFSLRNELSEGEYKRLVKTAIAANNERLALIIQTICATGIRVSELQYITAEAVEIGRAEVSCKGKYRIIFIPEKLRKILLNYIKKEKIFNGSVFVTRSGKPVDRSNIWRDMKNLCAAAYVDPEKVFPHNLRHLFARSFYALEKDIVRLSDLLGHSSVATTRIYIMEDGSDHLRQINLMNLVVLRS